MRRSLTTVTKTLLGVLVFLVSFSHTPLLAAGADAATYRIAHILLNFTHVPSVSQKATLRGILNDATTTAPEHVVAEALMNMEHIVSLEDRPKLETLIRNEAAPATVKMLASILHDLIHTPTDGDKEKLRGFLQQACRK